MARIAVIGAGLGGLPAALALRGALGGRHHITLIASSPHLEFVPMNPWIAVGWRKCMGARATLQRSLELSGVQWLAETVTGIDAAEAQLQLHKGGTLDYDYLVIATVPHDAQRELPGAELLGAAAGLCTHQQAPHAWSEYQQFLADPGPVVIAAVGSPACAGPAYEFALILDSDLRVRGLRNRVRITFVTCETSIGNMGLEDAQCATLFMAREMHSREIQYLNDAQVASVAAGRLQIVARSQRTATELAFRYAMVVPSVATLDTVKRVPGLCDASNMLLGEHVQRSYRYPNVFLLGTRAGQCHDVERPLQSPARIEPLLSTIRAELDAEAGNRDLPAALASFAGQASSGLPVAVTRSRASNDAVQRQIL